MTHKFKKGDRVVLNSNVRDASLAGRKGVVLTLYDTKRPIYFVSLSSRFMEKDRTIIIHEYKLSPDVDLSTNKLAAQVLLKK